MNASKENCRLALEKIIEIENESGVLGVDRLATEFIRNFLTVAVMRLPSEAAIVKDRQRKQCRKVGS